MLESYRQHVAERATLGIPPLPLSAQQTADLVLLLIGWEVMGICSYLLVGHHSEGRARRDAERIRRGMDRGVEESKRATDLARRAASVGTAGISSDSFSATA